MNKHLNQWYEIRKALYESMPNLTDTEKEKKAFDYNMFEWTYPTGIAMNAHRKYDEHPINRMQELGEDSEQLEKLMAEIEDKNQEDNE